MSTTTSRELELLQHHRDELAAALERVDILQFTEELCKFGIITKQTRQAFTNIDQRVKLKLKVKYLLQLVCDKVRQDNASYYILLTMLSSFDKNLDRLFQNLISCGSDEGQEQITDRLLTEQDIPVLMNDLASVAHKWEEIGIALRIPPSVRDDIGNGRGSSITKLDKILNAWITGGYKNPVTLNELKRVLASPLVGLSTITNSLSLNDPLPAIKRPRIDINQYLCSRILNQSLNTVVSYGMSTLLEVQIASDKPASFQWTKDDQPLFESSSYQGTTSSILLVNHQNMASQHIEGEYVCEVEGIGKSREILVTIEYPYRIQHLLDKYSSLKEVPKDTWPPVRTESFVKLALIKRESDNLKEYDYSVRGDMDDILCTKENISYEDCFGTYECGTLLVVEGRPGVGKTTLAHKVTRDWSTGKHVLIGAELVFLISLRILNARMKDSNLFEVLEYFYEVLDRDFIKDLELQQGLKSCFILDGLDEYKACNSKNSIIYNLINKKLSKAMVIVFTRPVGNRKIKRCGDTRIEILGFKSKQVNCYINSYFQSETSKSEQLMNYLDFHINVRHMCYLPVHAAMICYIHSKCKTIPNTETEIYERFALLTIIRKIMRDESSDPPTSLQHLDRECQNFFSKICELAFNMTVNSVQIFERKDTDPKLSDQSDSDEPCLGLVTIDSAATLYKIDEFYTFLHLTFQEYLAAYHLHRETSDQQISIVKQNKDNSAMLVVWKFYCGMMKHQTQTFHNQIQVIFSSEHADTLYRVHCAFESQQSVVCDAVTEHDKQHNSLTFQKKIFTPGDYYAINYVLSETSHPILSLEFYSCRLRKSGVEHLVGANNNRLENITTLVFHSTPLILDNFVILNSLLIKMKSLEVLDLSKTTLSPNAINILTEKNVTLPQLKCLKLQLPFRSSKDFVKLLNMLCFGSKPETVHYYMKEGKNDRYGNFLKRVYSNSNIIPINSDQTLGEPGKTDTFDLSNFKFEEHMSLDFVSSCSTFLFINCGIDDHTITILVEALKKSNSLEKLVLDFNNISGQGVTALIPIVTNLKHLSLQCNFVDDRGAKSLANALHKCTRLVHLDLECNSLEDEGAVAIASAVSHLNIHLYLWNANITEKGIISVSNYISSANIRSPQICDFTRVDTEDTECFTRALECCTSHTHMNIFYSSLSSKYEEQFKSFTNLKELHLVHQIPRNKDYFESEKYFCKYMPRACTVLKLFMNLQALYINDGIGLQTNDVHSENTDSFNTQTLADGLKSFTNLQTLDISGNYIGSKGVAALADIFKSCTNLHTLNIKDSNIGSEGAAALADGLKSCTDLQTLDIRVNRIGSKGAAALADGLKFCTNLQTLDISGNNIGSAGAAALADGLKSCTNLHTLNIKDSNIGSEGAAALADGLKSCTDLQTLDIRVNRIGSKGAAALADGLKFCTNLQTLDISGNNIGSAGAAALADGLKSCTNLQTLDISGNSYNNIGSEGAAALADGLKSCTNLQTLNIRESNIGSEGAAALADGLESCTNLQTLDISGNNIGSEGAAALADGLKSCTNLQTLDISGNNIGSEGAAALADGLKSCTNLLTLDISGHNVFSGGAAALADGLKSCTNLQTLNIRESNISSEGAAALADGLKSCTNLQTLDIRKNTIGPEGAAALADGLKSCTNLQTLDIRGNNIGSEGAAALADSLKSCTNLQTLDISGNNIGSEGAAALADGLKSCTDLQTLIIRGNTMGSEGAAALADGLKSCTNLQTLDISWNNIGSEGAAALADGLKSCTDLQTLDIRGNTMGSEGAAALADGLKSCTDLQTLDIRVGSEGAAALADGLKSCTNLRIIKSMFDLQ